MDNKRIAEVFPPGEFIKEELEARNWNQNELAEIIGYPASVISNLIIGKRQITPEIAKALGEAFGTSAQYWMNLESSYQLWKTKDVDSFISRRSKLYQIAPIKEMVKRHWIESSENIDVMENRVKSFFGINNLDERIHFDHAARKSSSEATPAQIAWIFRAKQLAFGVSAKPFSEQSFDDCLIRLRQYLHNTQEIRHVPRTLAEHGIRFLVLEHLPHTKIDGAVFWLDKKSPVVVLSLRYDRIDAFWHTLAHELGHIKNKDGLKNDGVLDIDLVGDDAQPIELKLDIEAKADAFAVNFLINQSELTNLIARVRPLYGAHKISGFAERIKVHPGIVVGQLQYRKEVPYSSFRPMLDKVRSVIIPSALTDGWGQQVSI